MSNVFKKRRSYGKHLTLYANYAVEVIYDACSCCYDNAKSDFSFFKKIEYISKRVSAGHDSVLEHGFVSMIIYDIELDKEDLYKAISEITGPGHYLYIYTSTMEDGTENIMIGGSIRAYRHLIKNIENRDNFIFNHIVSVLQNTTVKEFYCDLFKEGIFEEHYMNGFLSIPHLEYCSDEIKFDDLTDNEFNGRHRYVVTDHINDSVAKNPKVCLPTAENMSEKINIVDFPYEDDYQFVYIMGHRYGFTFSEISNVIPITILFKNMSRTATHQLVRHRNGITQESQRYTNYNKARFTVPPTFEDKEFSIALFGTTKKLSLAELGKELCGVYTQLTKQGLKREDARAFLPSNVQCKRLYMTFTINTLLKFVELRADKHSQAEIRGYATEIQKHCLEDCGVVHNYLCEWYHRELVYLAPWRWTQSFSREFIIGFVED